MKHRSSYEEFEASSAANRRLLREEELFVDVTARITEAMERDAISQAELARRLDRSASYVSQLLGGGRNLTLRTLADVADALELRVKLDLPRLMDTMQPFVFPPVGRNFDWQWKHSVVFSEPPKPASILPLGSVRAPDGEEEMAA